MPSCAGAATANTTRRSATVCTRRRVSTPSCARRPSAAGSACAAIRERLPRSQIFQRLAGRRGGGFEVCGRVSGAGEGGFVLGGCQVEAALQHPVEKATVAGGVGGAGAVPVGDRAGGEEEGHH